MLFLSRVVFLVCFTSVLGYSAPKKAYIVTGPESSGSVLIAQVIAYVLGKDSFYKQWSGYEINGEIGDELVIMHTSQPFHMPSRFRTLSEFRELLDGYDLCFIITTRDINIVKKSKKHRFGYSDSETETHQKISKKILDEIIQKEKFFIWNYETQIFLRESYYRLLYDFIQVKSDFFPKDLFDGNEKYM
jgi:hypothetical protein